LSVSHCGDTAFCALYAASDDAPSNQDVFTGLPTSGLIQIGADIECVEARSEGFVQAYFTPEEIKWIDEAPVDLRDLMVTATWSAKEAVLKSLRLGLVVDTRRVSCLCRLMAGSEAEWSAVLVQCDPALLPEALQRAGWPVRDIDVCDCEWSVTGWWRREADFVLTLAALQIDEGR